MVKADLTRDYYGDLGLPVNADANDIKKQFKKLALLYHPDRNPGRESEVTARFQRIQSAHEVLTDIHERTKYDANRIVPNPYRTGGNPRGNPWSGVSSQFPTPPKPPTARSRHPPPPSAGAQRYKNFETPKHPASQTAHEGAEARRSTYEAWERMNPSWKPGSGHSKPSPQPKKAPKAAANDSHTSKPSARAGTHGQNPTKKGFMPNTPGGDEPAAPKGAYSTYREKPAHPPQPSSDSYTHIPEQHAEDSFKYSMPKPTPAQFEPRISTPYATHGGEKFNPFEAVNLNRSKSTRAPSGRYSSGGIPRVGSDPNLKSPQRPQSQGPGFKKPDSTYSAPDSDDSSSDESPYMKKKTPPRASATTAGTRTFAKARSFTGSRTTNTPFPAPSTDGQPSGYSQPQNTNAPTPENPAASNPANPQKTSEQKMYENFRYMPVPRGELKSVFGPPTVSEQVANPQYCTPIPISREPFSKDTLQSKLPDVVPDFDDPQSTERFTSVLLKNLFPLEEAQRSVIDNLINRRNTNGSSAGSGESNGKSGDSFSHQPSKPSARPASSAFRQYRESPNVASPPKKPRHYGSPFEGTCGDENTEPCLYHMYSTNANYHGHHSFSFGGDGAAFQPTGSSGFYGVNTESVNKTFAAEQWHEKFAASHFVPDLGASGVRANSRTQSGSRSRGRSPIKSRSNDKNPMQARVDPDSSESSPGSTKFSQDEWAGTFRPQTFMPPPPATVRPPRNSRVSSKPTMGTAAVVEDEDAPDGKPLFKGHKASAAAVPSPPSPDPMDVDTPASSSTPLTGEPKTDRPPKQTPVPSPPSTDTESLKINFEDLKIRDLISTLNLPRAPVAPQIPAALLPPTKDTFEAYFEKFKSYMADWDLFSNRMVLHLVARKNQNDSLGATRWMNDEGIVFYRKGLQEDSAVLKWWNGAIERHGENMKQCQVLKASSRGQSARTDLNRE